MKLATTAHAIINGFIPTFEAYCHYFANSQGIAHSRLDREMARRDYNEFYPGFGWACTDTDEQRYRKSLGPRVFALRQLGRRKDGKPYSRQTALAFWDDKSKWENAEIWLDRFSTAQWEDYAEIYYGSLSELQTQHPDEWPGLLAECIFATNLVG
jgi:hypothetical protein